ncbi:hypothetical protein J5Y03_08560 [Bacillus sp. RG28]|uniref:Uncharacterized protein n=1 Tax=Gottfriedia endophytica TaxID=2820819 RepID=A0A940SJT2_9BACI|nr:hypothetical protein [Gottfriedia endophytica]MBP0725239.1 hypothetical protein [Gottfriedia endophytica]
MEINRKIVSFSLVSTLTGVLLLGSTPASIFAASSKLTNTQSVLKNQISTYIKQLNILKKEFALNDSVLYGNYTKLQSYVKDFVKYNYTGVDELKYKTATFKTKIDKTRKDNGLVDMKKVTATFNTYLKKNDAKNANAYYTKQRSFLLKVLDQQDELKNAINEYTQEVEFQFQQENESYIQSMIPTEYGNYQTASIKTFSRMMDVFLKEQDILNQAYQVLNMNFTIKMQIQDDIEKMMGKYQSVLGVSTVKNDDLIDAIKKRDVGKAKLAIGLAMKQLEIANSSIDQLLAELDQYQQNLPNKFPNYVKNTSATK